MTANEEAELRARTRDFQHRHGESFWDISQEEFDAITKRVEAEEKQTRGKASCVNAHHS